LTVCIIFADAVQFDDMTEAILCLIL